jgi:hypothetical protein
MLNRAVGFALRNGHGLPGLSGPKSAKSGGIRIDQKISA